METITLTFHETRTRFHGRTYWICHSKHEHDRTYAENVYEFLSSVGVACKIIEFETPGQRPELQQCLNDRTIAVLGFNSQLDHCWINDESFVALAAKLNVPTIHWFQDHPSSRWPEFTQTTAENSRFLFMSSSSSAISGATALPMRGPAGWPATGPIWRSRLHMLSPGSYLERTIALSHSTSGELWDH